MEIYHIHPKTSIGHIELQVSNLKQTLEFYVTGVGLVQTAANTDAVMLTSMAGPRLFLTENQHAEPRPPHTTGLYHAAFLFASRSDLASVYRNMLNIGYQFHGFADHGVSETLYLSDPDGIGIELYTDKPRNEWPFQDGQLHMGTADLDIQNLMELATLRKPDADIKVGHVHLNVSDLARTEFFYTTVLGFHVVQRDMPGALFFAAGDYHHHIGANVWQGIGASPSPDNSVGMKKFALELPGTDSMNELRNHLIDTGYPFLADGRDLIIKDPDSIEIKIVCAA
jgi:catechol 2,3-dioxygenase